MAVIVVRYLPNGDLDETFGVTGTGIVRTPLNGSERAVVAMAVNPQNQITVVTDGQGFQAVRYREDGTLVTSFGENGILGVSTPFPVSDAFIEIVQPVTKLAAAAPERRPGLAPGNPLDIGPFPVLTRLAVVGTDVTASPDSFAVGRYQPFAQPDQSFNEGNHVTTNFDGRPSRANCVRVDGDSRIYAAGSVPRDDGTATTSMALTRYRFDGAPDSSFNHGAGRVERPVVTHPFGVNDFQARAIAFGRQGSIVIGGDVYSHSSDADAGFLMRFTSDGDPDTQFSTDGLFLNVFAGIPENSYVTAVAVDGLNRTVVVGTIETPNREFAVARHRADGVRDTFFNGTGLGGTGGIATTGFVNALRSWPGAVTVGRADGIITVVGGADGAFAVARFRDNGKLATSFSGDGRVTTAVGEDNEWAFANEVAIDGRGRIVVAGVSITSVE
jgi:uncharacterized delta-60 repeat protein